MLFFGMVVSAKEPQYSNISGHQIAMSKDKAVELKKRFPKEASMARLYLFKNSRVKKELAFKTKANKAKLA
ncbi:MAG: hypothetical protein AAF039_09160 [Bacteroidota bacterium]